MFETRPHMSEDAIRQARDYSTLPRRAAKVRVVIVNKLSQELGLISDDGSGLTVINWRQGSKQDIAR